jgi:hypothetical protein
MLAATAATAATAGIVGTAAAGTAAAAWRSRSLTAARRILLFSACLLNLSFSFFANAEIFAFWTLSRSLFLAIA